MPKLKYYMEIHLKRKGSDPVYLMFDSLEERDAARTDAEAQLRESHGLTGVMVRLKTETIPADQIERISIGDYEVGGTVRDVYGGEEW